MNVSTTLIKRNNKVHISINLKKKLIRQNIYSTLTGKIVYQEMTRCASGYDTIKAYYDEIYKFSYLGYRIVGGNTGGKVLPLVGYKEEKTS